MMNVFGTIGDGVSGAAKKVTQTIQETDFKEKFSEGYEKAKLNQWQVKQWKE